MSEEFKQIDYDELVKNSYMISIDDERYDLTCKVLDKVLEWHPNKCFGEIGVSHDEKVKLNLKSHLDIIKYARAHDLPYVFIFEDDAYPCIDCANKIKEYIKIIPNDANIFMLGYIHDAHAFGLQYKSIDTNRQDFSNKINRINSVLYGAHAYIVFKNAYDMCIDLILDSHDPIDVLLFNKLVDNSYVVDDSLFIQYNYKKSDISECDTGYLFFNKSILYQSKTKDPPVNFKDIKEILL